MTSEHTIREIVRDYGRLGVDVNQLSDTADLYRAGLTSHATISLMLALEDSFDVEFPATAMRKSTFTSIAAMRQVIDDLTTAVAAADRPASLADDATSVAR